MQIVPYDLEPLRTIQDDYKDALIHVAWDRHTTGSRLLFALVELFPTEFPPIEDEPILQKRLGGSSCHYVYLKRLALPAIDALRWYLERRKRVNPLLTRECRLAHEAGENTFSLSLPTYSEEPDWPTLTTVDDNDDDERIPFLSRWHHSVRSHSLIPLGSFFDGYWTPVEKKLALDWLRDRLGFELNEYPEFLGSVNLLLPNPVFRRVECRLYAPKQEEPRAVDFRIEARVGANLGALQLVIGEERFTGRTSLRVFSIEYPIVRVEFGRDVHFVFYAIVCPSRGLLHYSGPTGFIESVDLRMFLITGTKQVQVSEGETISIDRHFPADERTRPRPQLSTARSVLIREQAARKERRDARRWNQQWFFEENEPARDFIQSLIKPAQDRVLIIDPYFSDQKELFRYALIAHNPRTPIQIVTSAEVLRSTITVTKDGALVQKENGNLLKEHLDRLKADERVNNWVGPIRVRVMSGEKSPIHDRFLVVDDSVWHLGSSLNDLGSRGTLILKVPSPTRILADIFEIIDSDATKDLEAWCIERQENRGKE